MRRQADRDMTNDEAGGRMSSNEATHTTAAVVDPLHLNQASSSGCWVGLYSIPLTRSLSLNPKIDL